LQHGSLSSIETVSLPAILTPAVGEICRDVVTTSTHSPPTVVTLCYKVLRPTDTCGGGKLKQYRSANSNTFSMLRFIFLLALLAPLAPSLSAAHATDASCEEESDECATIGQWSLSLGLGFGSRSNPVKFQRDIPLVVVPKLSYYGKRFFLENLELGVTLVETKSHSFNLIATPGYDRVFFFRNDLQNFFAIGGNGAVSNTPPQAGPPPQQAQPSDAELILAHDRDVTYLVGPEWNFNLGRFIGQLDALYEITGEHCGVELRGAVAASINSSESLVFTGGATWKSSDTVTYYYGAKGVYEPDAALNPFVKLSYKLPLSENWALNAFAHVEWLDSPIADSPIVFEDQVTTVFAGVFYSF
jgi:outer membrane protein